MISILVKKEILNNLLNMRFVLAYFLCTVLLVGSAAIMVSDYLNQRRAYSTDSSLYRRQQEGQKGRPVQSNHSIAREPLVTSVFALGSEKDAGRRAVVSFWFSPAFRSELRRDPLANLFPTIDLTFIIGVIFSLLIFALAYDAVSGEREEGSLKVLLAGPVTRAGVITAKWIGTYITIMVPCVTAWTAAALLLTVTPGISVSPQEWVRILGILFMSALYVACMVSLSIMVSTLFRHGTTVMLALLLVWVVLVLGVPSMSGPAAVLLTRPAGIENIENKTLRYGTWLEEDIPDNPAMNNITERELAGRNWDSVGDAEHERIRNLENLSGHYWNRVRIAMVSKTERAHAVTLSTAEELARWFSRISPFGCYENASISLAGTGHDREQELNAAMERYLPSAYEYMSEPPESDHGFPPAFQIRRTGLGTAAAQALPDAGILALMTVLFFMVAFVAFVRAEVA